MSGTGKKYWGKDPDWEKYEDTMDATFNESPEEFRSRLEKTGTWNEKSEKETEKDD